MVAVGELEVRAVVDERLTPLGTPLQLPAVLTNSKMAFTFGPHATRGVTLTTIDHLEGSPGAFSDAFSDAFSAGGTTFRWVNAQASDNGTVDGRLWEILVRPESAWSDDFSGDFGGGSVAVLPSANVVLTGTINDDSAPSSWSDAFSAAFGNGPVPTPEGQPDPFILLRWTEIPIPGLSDTINVDVLVSLGPDDLWCRWRCFVTRTGATGSIDQIDCPILAIRGPARQRPGKTHAQSQTRARLLVPAASLPPLGSVNQSLTFWSGGSMEAWHPHGPGQNQPLPFSCLASVDPEDEASNRRVLWLGAEDSEFSIKQFIHRGVPALNGENLLYRWAHRYLPQFATYPPNDIDRASESGNVHFSTHSAVVAPILAKTDAWWFDCCEFYRENFIYRLGLFTHRLEQDDERSDLSRETPWFGCIGPQTITGLILYQLYKTMMLEGLEFTQAKWGAGQWQTVLHPQSAVSQRHGGGTGVLNPDNPVSSSIDDGVAQTVAECNATGRLRVAPYTEGKLVEEIAGWTNDLTAAARINNRDGSPRLPGIWEFDLGTKEGRERFPSTMFRQLIEGYGFSGLYCDGVAGGYAYLTYDPPAGTIPVRGHLAHGGSYWTDGKRAFWRIVREVLREFGPFGPDDRDYYLISEVVEEGLTDLLDLQTEGYIFLPNTLLMAENAIFGTSILADATVVQDEARHWSPPLWALCYHEFSMIGRFGIPLTKIARADNPAFYPYSRWPGLSEKEWNDIIGWVWSNTWISGYKMLISIVSDMFDHRVLPSSTDRCIVLIKAMYQSIQVREFGGKFLLYGAAMRPLQVDYRNDPWVMMQQQPAYLSSRAISQRDGVWGNPPLMPVHTRTGGFSDDYSDGFDNGFETAPFGWGTGIQDFDSPCVLHSVWRSPEGSIGIALVNWTHGVATWRGVFDPSLYDLPLQGAPFSGAWSSAFQIEARRFLVSRLDPDGTKTPIGIVSDRVTLVGGTAFEFFDPVTLTLQLGPVPSGSVQIYELEPTTDFGVSAFSDAFSDAFGLPRGQSYSAAFSDSYG